MAGLFSILAIICYLICFYLVEERVPVQANNQKLYIGKMIKSIVTNRSLLGIIVAAILLLLAQLGMAGMVGALLNMVGYTQETAFEPAVTEGIFNMSCIVPIVGMTAVALALMFIYSLNKKKVEKGIQSMICYIKRFKNDE